MPGELPLIRIFYGSQMGTGEEFAEELGQRLSSEGFDNEVFGMEDMEESDLPNYPICIFFQATYGNGRCTCNY